MIKSVVILLFVLVYSVCPAQKNDKRSDVSKVLFTNLNIIDVRDGSIHHNMDLLVEGTIISDIYENRNSSSLKKDALVIPSDGKYIMPGLVDCHTHIIFKNELIDYLCNGVTTVFSLGSPPAVLDFRQQVAEGRLDGPDIYAARMLDGIREDWGGIVLNKTVTSVVDVAPIMEEIKKEKWDLIKVYNSLTTAEFDEIIKFARSYGLPVIGHGVREPGMKYILDNGMVMVAHAEEFIYTFFKNDLDENKIPDAVAFTKKSGAFVCPNLSTFETLNEQWGDSLRFSHLVNESENLKQFLDSFTLNSWFHNNSYIHRQGSVQAMYTFLKKLTLSLYKAGVPLVAGTDSPIIPGCFPGYSLAKDLQILSEVGLTNADALKTATLVPGQFIRKYVPQRPMFGLIEVGYKADLLLLNENPVESLQNLRNINGVMKSGKWYTKNELDSIRNQMFAVK